MMITYIFFGELGWLNSNFAVLNLRLVDFYFYFIFTMAY